MQTGEFCDIAAIAPRSADKAKQIAEDLNIPQYYGSYDELLKDSEIEAIYNPLPNHLHFEWTRKAAEAGKHVLCEKPLGMNASEVEKLIEVRNLTGVKIQEAFMVRTHPQWIKVKALIKSGRIGKLKNVTGFFSYFNDDKSNIRNKQEMGGGVMDIGCYCINIARFVFDEEPLKVAGLITNDSETGIDKITSSLLDFPGGQAVFSCSTQLVPFQRMQFFGTKGRIEVPIPFNIPVDMPTKILIDDGSDLYGRNIEITEIPAANQYTIQGDLFSRAIFENSEQAISLEDSLQNMSVIEAVFRAAKSNISESPHI